MFTRDEFRRMIDHTNLKATASRQDIVNLCREARERGFAAVCVNSFWAPVAAAELEGTPVRVCVTVGFPLGASLTAVKACEASEAVKAGATEIDMVMNIGALKDGDYETVRSDIAAVVRAAKDEGARRGVDVLVKVIIETCYLTAEEKVAACRLCVEAGAAFVKTSTGLGPGGATVEDVRIMAGAVGGRAGVKAAGGIQTFGQARAMVEAGASRIGTSRGIALDDGMGGEGY